MAVKQESGEGSPSSLVIADIAVIGSSSLPFCHSEQSEESAFWESERTADSSRQGARNDKNIR
jgi:hypothetical protein